MISLLTSKAILLKLEAGSHEAGFLAEIYPLPKTPTFVIILRGELKGYLVSGISKDDFLRRMREAFIKDGPETSKRAESPDHAEASASPSTGLHDDSISRVNSQGSAKIKAFLEERKIRMEREKKEHDEKFKAARKADDAARRILSNEGDSADPTKEANRDYAALQNQRRKEAREERERILKRVEDDKIERRERESLRRQQACTTVGMDEGTLNRSPPASTRAPAVIRGAECAVQVRLFDGSMIRARFPSTHTLRRDVRPWIEEQRGIEDKPYVLRLILTPLPNRTIGDSEEEESLQDIGLWPSATLILVEVKAFNPAYSGDDSGILRWGLKAGHGLITSTVTTSVNAVTGVLGGIFGVTPGQSGQLSNMRSHSQPPESNDHQFYNGNSLSFEPRPNDINKEE